jgi:hypothetical protein
MRAQHRQRIYPLRAQHRAVANDEPDDAWWAFLRSGPVRVLRWLAAVAIVALSWYVQGSSHDSAEVIYPLVLAGLMFAPDVRKFKISTPFGDAEGELGREQRQATSPRLTSMPSGRLSEASRTRTWPPHWLSWRAP